MANRLIPAILLAGASILSVACSRLDMQDQPKFKAQHATEFFADGRTDRPELDGTIARGELHEDVAYYQGKDAAGKDIAEFPIAVDKAVIQRGQQRYDIYCAPCHGRDGRGTRAIADSSYLALVTDQHLRTVIIVGMPQLGMPDWRSHNKPLTDTDVGDLVAWLAARREALSAQLKQ